MMMITTTLHQALSLWLSQNKDVFFSEDIPHGLCLTEVETKKQKKIIFGEIQNWRVKENTEGFGSYLNLVLENGHELVLCHVGFAFSPFYQEESPPQPLPQVTCFQDFYRLRGHLEHIYLDITQRRETLQTLTNAIAILAGAHWVGLETGPEEKLLEPILEWLEKE